MMLLNVVWHCCQDLIEILLHKVDLYKHAYIDTVVIPLLSKDGPQIVRGPEERAVRLGDPLMLECGSGLDSNPEATVTWRDPEGAEVVDNARYDLIQSDAGLVRLDFANTIPSDMGTWRCEIRVDGINVTLPGGDIGNRLIGSEVNIEILLHIVGEFARCGRRGLVWRGLGLFSYQRFTNIFVVASTL